MSYIALEEHFALPAMAEQWPSAWSPGEIAFTTPASPPPGPDSTRSPTALACQGNCGRTAHPVPACSVCYRILFHL
jgi:hypothetical protein